MSKKQLYIIALCLRSEFDKETKIEDQLPSEYFMCDESNVLENFIFLMQRHEGITNNLLYIKILKPNEELNDAINKKYEANDEIEFNLKKYIKAENILNNSDVLLFTGGVLGLNSKIYNESNFIDALDALDEPSKLYNKAINNLRHIIFLNVEKYTNAYINGNVETMAGHHIAGEYENAIKHTDLVIQNAIKNESIRIDEYDFIVNAYVKAMEDTDAILKKNLKNNGDEYIISVNEYVEIKNKFINHIENIKNNIKKLGDIKNLFLNINDDIDDSRFSVNRLDDYNQLQADKLVNGKQHYVGLLYYYDDDPYNIKINYFICDSSNFGSNVLFWINRFQNSTENLSYIKILKPNFNLNKVIEDKLKELKDLKIAEFNLLKDIKLEAIEKHSFLLFFSGGVLGINKVIFNQNYLGIEAAKYEEEYALTHNNKANLAKEMSHYMEEILSNHEEQKQSIKVANDKRKMSESTTSDYLDLASKGCSKLTEEDDDDEDEGDSGKEGLRPH